MPRIFTALALGLASGFSSYERKEGCPELYWRGVLDLDFNPAFLHVDEYADGQALTITSFFNLESVVIPPAPPFFNFFSEDLVARAILDADASFPGAAPVEVLTDQAFLNIPKWPNEAELAPAGIFPFEALVVCQGFLSPVARPGRISAINMATKEENVVAGAGDWFYHRVVYIDMDGDGVDDVVTVRSNWPAGPPVTPPSPPPYTQGQLVWFRNPGTDAFPWAETVLVSSIASGPDIFLQAADLDGDGTEEIVATSFFGSEITLYGAAAGGWAATDAQNIRSATISTGRGLCGNQPVSRGRPFGIELVDLDLDGKLDVLATNHQQDNCPAFPESIAGAVYAIAQPAGDLFADAWTTTILFDGIFPQPSVAGARSSRLAPGKAKAFYPSRAQEADPSTRPCIVVGGDEAGKVWILTPVEGPVTGDLEYEDHVIFDINVAWGDKCATQTDVRPGVTISTLGAVETRYDRTGADGVTEIFIPVFEGKAIYVYSFRAEGSLLPVECLPDETLGCDECGSPGPP